MSLEPEPEDSEPPEIPIAEAVEEMHRIADRGKRPLAQEAPILSD